MTFQLVRDFSRVREHFHIITVAVSICIDMYEPIEVQYSAIGITVRYTEETLFIMCMNFYSEAFIVNLPFILYCHIFV